MKYLIPENRRDIQNLESLLKDEAFFSPWWQLLKSVSSAQEFKLQFEDIHHDVDSEISDDWGEANYSVSASYPMHFRLRYSPADAGPTEPIYLIGARLAREIELKLEIERRSQKVMELKKLTDSQNLFESVTTLSPGGIFLTDVSGQATYVNKKWTEQSGISFEEAINGQAYKAFFEEDREELYRQWQVALEKIEGFRHEYRMKNVLTGEITNILCLATPLKDHEQRPIGFVGINHDVTEFKQTQNKLIYQTRLMEHFIENLPAAVAVLDRNLNYIYVSHQFILDYKLNFSGHNTQSLKGKNHYEIFPDVTAEWQAAHQQALIGKTIKKTDDSYDTLTGETVWFDWEVRPWFEAENKIGGILMQTLDTTSKKQAELKLKVAHEEAQKATEAKSIFLAGMSHEMRTPLHSIIGYADLLLESVLDIDQRNHLMALAKSSDHLLALINDVLDLSKIESGTVNIKNHPLYLKDICEDLRQMFLLRCLEKNISFTVTIDHAEKVFQGDATRISQILVNLLGNSCKFTDKGEIRLTITSNDSGRKGNLLFVVTDTGKGISQDHLTKVFEAFYQEGQAENKRISGSGLGLSIAKELIDLMGGEIWLQSEVGVGSKFSFTLDLKEIQPTLLASAPQPKIEASKHGHRVPILIVDDSIENRTLMKAFLKNTLYDVHFAENGLEGLNLMKQIHFPLVFMDIQMPVMNGKESTYLYREWEKNHSQPKSVIIALSACGLTEEIGSALSSGCDDYLVKPTKKDKILSTLDNWLKDH